MAAILKLPQAISEPDIMRDDLKTKVNLVLLSFVFFLELHLFFLCLVSYFLIVSYFLNCFEFYSYVHFHFLP